MALLLDIDVSFSSLHSYHAFIFFNTDINTFCYALDLFGDKDYAENSDLDGFITSVLEDDGAPLTP